MNKRVYQIELKWSTSVDDQEEFQKLREIFPTLRFLTVDDMARYDERELPEEEQRFKKEERLREYMAEWPRQVKADIRETVYDLELVDPLLFHHFEIKRAVPVVVEVPTSPSGLGWEDIVARMERAAEKASLFNGKCDVHVGGGQLMLVNDLLLLIDACTDALQDALDKGWRIVACCVQPDGRRPDYVLGRYDPARAERLEAKLTLVGGARREL